MSNFLNNIKLIASELANMSPKTQLEIVKLCKNLCLNVKDYLVELDETTLVNITTRLDDLEDEMTTAEGNIQANANAIDTINDAIDLINTALNNRYTKSEIDALLLNIYTKNETNTLLTNKLNIQTISLSGQSGTLTEEELNKVLNKQNIIIEKDGIYFYKSGDVNNYLVFTKLSFDLTLFTKYDSVNKYEINIYKSNGNWTYRAITLYTYTKEQIDALIPHLYKYYCTYLNISTNDGDELYMCFETYFNEDIENLFNELNTYSTSLKAYTDLMNILNKIKCITFVGGGDIGFSGIMYKNGNNINVEFDGNTITLYNNNISNINASHTYKLQLF